jgi:hypothetical protein
MTLRHQAGGNRSHRATLAPPALIALALLAAGPAALAAEPGELSETRCGWQIEQADGSYRTQMTPDLRVLEQAALPGAFAPDVPANARAVNCGRTSIVMAEHDDEVIMLGFPLIITEAIASPDRRIGVLEIVGGRYQFRMLQGAFTEAEERAINDRINVFQLRSQGQAPAQ